MSDSAVFCGLFSLRRGVLFTSAVQMLHGLFWIFQGYDLSDEYSYKIWFFAALSGGFIFFVSLAGFVSTLQRVEEGIYIYFLSLVVQLALAVIHIALLYELITNFTDRTANLWSICQEIFLSTKKGRFKARWFFRLFRLQLWMYLAALDAFFVVYNITITYSLLLVLEAGGTGDEYLSAEDMLAGVTLNHKRSLSMFATSPCGGDAEEKEAEEAPLLLEEGAAASASEGVKESTEAGRGKRGSGEKERGSRMAGKEESKTPSDKQESPG
uniref:Uncharacterized protein n=1 Tax=Chromera velia CCMP2878 TaxID=1169474 RepID=A0A0G4FJ17_9ALVE|eukprot:Cvel_17298.t1-p1 / transcript=Cvel_17298.t1 / gene=Cvel_17298 / organism=Chromera_velia_CCMP2878 / gene_product=hypothetical protein / transcript_product=hypothetical protein / location=Cvel_scaffold1373:22064-22867(+) / protein_length=268 / sequence_SO=supercontig / SO=protein_coding / is_pseudo=false